MKIATFHAGLGRRIMKRILLSAMALGLVASSARAASFDFTTGVPDFVGFGNSLTKTDGGVTVVLTGWSVGGGSGAEFTQSQVRVFSTGVGTCSSSEGLNCPSGPHTVDNDGRDEVLLLTFDQPVLLTEAVITAWASDYDASFWAGTGSITMSETTLLGLGTQHDSEFSGSATAGTSFRTVSLSGISTPVDWLVFGVEPGESNDKFKFKSLVVSVPPPPPNGSPEPGVLLLLGIGAVLLATRKR